MAALYATVRLLLSALLFVTLRALLRTCARRSKAIEVELDPNATTLEGMWAEHARKVCDRRIQKLEDPAFAEEYSAGVTEQADRWEQWELIIRSPAEKENEGSRHLDCGAATAEYCIALLPDGRFAVRFHCHMEADSGMDCPWRAFPTRQQAVDFFREQGLAFFLRAGKVRGDREQARRKIMKLLEGEGLFGFEEPEPEK